jgi:hypothetical protein
MRQTKYTPEIAAEICGRLAEGESLRSICRDERIPAESTVRGWDLDNVQGFSAEFKRAREIGTDVEFERLAEMASEEPRTVKGFTDAGWVNWKRNQIDTFKWMLARKLPKKYGDKIAHTGEDGGAIQFVVTRAGRKE